MIPTLSLIDFRKWSLENALTLYKMCIYKKYHIYKNVYFISQC